MVDDTCATCKDENMERTMEGELHMRWSHRRCRASKDWHYVAVVDSSCNDSRQESKRDRGRPSSLRVYLPEIEARSRPPILLAVVSARKRSAIVAVHSPCGCFCQETIPVTAFIAIPTISCHESL